MKIRNILLLAFILLSIAVSANAQKVIFLRHSTGSGVYSEGKVSDWINNYNSNHATHYEISERNYPNSPYPWANYA